MAVFTDEHGHQVVTLGFGTTAISLAKSIDSDVDDQIVFSDQEYKPIGQENPELVGISTDELPKGTVRVIFKDTHALWYFLDTMEKMAQQHREKMKQWEDEHRVPQPTKMRQA